MPKLIRIDAAGQPVWAEDELMTRQSEYVAHVFSSEDAREGATAFAQKRKPEWKGR